MEEVVLGIHLLLGSATFVVGGYAVVYDRPRVSLTGLAGLGTMFLTFISGLYGLSANTQLVVSLGLIWILAAMVATWILATWAIEAVADENAS